MVLGNRLGQENFCVWLVARGRKGDKWLFGQLVAQPTLGIAPSPAPLTGYSEVSGISIIVWGQV
jgi:hypothetical protein